MVEIEVRNGEVVIQVLGAHKFWALKSRLSFKIGQLRSVSLADPSLRPPWCRCPGTYLPRVICAGTYYGKGRKEFWDTGFKGKAVQLELRDAKYTRVVVDVADPDDVLRRVSNAI